MNAIKAIWTNGQIVPAEPVDWPDGSELLVEPVPPHEKIGMQEEDWDDSPEGIAKWCEAVDKIEPLVWAEGEEEEYQHWREEVKKFNVEAVAKQMEQLGEGNAR